MIYWTLWCGIYGTQLLGRYGSVKFGYSSKMLFQFWVISTSKRKKNCSCKNSISDGEEFEMFVIWPYFIHLNISLFQTQLSLILAKLCVRDNISVFSGHQMSGAMKPQVIRSKKTFNCLLFFLALTLEVTDTSKYWVPGLATLIRHYFVEIPPWLKSI